MFRVLSTDFIISLAPLFVITTLLTGIVVFFEKRDPSKTLMWLLVLALLPGLGFVLYLIFGENLRKRKVGKNRKKIKKYISSKDYQGLSVIHQLAKIQREGIQDETLFNNRDHGIMKLLLNSGDSPITINNKVDIFTEGVCKFDSLLRDLEKAKDHIHLEYFILKPDEMGWKLHDVLKRKAQEGVAVRILLDDFGSRQLIYKRRYVRELVAVGCEVHSFLQGKFPFIHRNINHRDHRKIVVIDGSVGYVGGINIGDEYVHKSPYFGFWRDTHLRLEGESVYMLQEVFLFDWFIRTRSKLTGSRLFPAFGKQLGEAIVQIATSGADSAEETIYQAYFYGIAQAKKTVYIQTPYFIPDEALFTAIKTALLSGVDVRVMFPSFPDHYSVYYASHSYLEEVLELGAKVYFYKKGFIHSKVVLIDDTFASVGTANMDIRSFILNSEINAFIYDKERVAALYEIFFQDMEDCQEAKLKTYKEKSVWRRFIESACRLFSPLL